MANRSAAQIAASRANGAKSQGPVSEAGKSYSAGNSKRHGLCSQEFVLDTAEEQTRFDGLVADLIFTHQAKNPLEEDACRHLAVAMWRRRVCDNLEREVLIAIAAGRVCAMSGGDGLPGLNTLARYRARIARDMREARAEIAELKAARVQAFQAELTKAKEMASLGLLGEIKKDLGETAFGALRQEVTKSSPKAPAGEAQTNPSNTELALDAGLNRPSRRRLEKLARKQNRRK